MVPPSLQPSFHLPNARMRNREMVVVVYGFPSKTTALQFEWGWTYPHQCTTHHRHLSVLGPHCSWP